MAFLVTRNEGLPISRKRGGFGARKLFGERFTAIEPSEEDQEKKERSLMGQFPPMFCIHINIQK